MEAKDAKEALAIIREWQNDRRGALATQRYQRLVRQLGEERGNRYGWKAAAGRRLGVHPSYVSKILEDEVAMVGADVIVRACDRLGISLEYFIANEAHSYADFLERSEAVAEAQAPDDTLRRVVKFSRLLARRADAIREAEITGSPEIKLRKARDMAQAILAQRQVIAAQAITVTDDPEEAWGHALALAAYAEAGATLVDAWELIRKASTGDG